MEQEQIKVKKLHSNARLPEFKSAQAAGADLYCVGDYYLEPGEFRVIGTGIAVDMPDYFFDTVTELQIRPRSGLAAKHGVTVLNGPGTVDADYKGEIKVILINLGTETVHFTTGDRIAQAVVGEVPKRYYVWVEELSETERGSGGMGSTGLK